jgi:hypothetical protein
MGFQIVLMRPNASIEEMRSLDERWEDHKYVGNGEFFSLAMKDAEWNQNGGLCGESCFRPKDLAALREAVVANPPGGCGANIPIWSDLIDALEADASLYLDGC